MHNEKRIRFGRFDCINDKGVSKALLDVSIEGLGSKRKT